MGYESIKLLSAVTTSHHELKNPIFSAWQLRSFGKTEKGLLNLSWIGIHSISKSMPMISFSFSVIFPKYQNKLLYETFKIMFLNSFYSLEEKIHIIYGKNFHSLLQYFTSF